MSRTHSQNGRSLEYFPNLNIQIIMNPILLYNSPNIVKLIKSRRLTGHVARIEKFRISFKMLADKPSGKIPLGRPRHRQVENTRIDIKAKGLKGQGRRWVLVRIWWSA